MQLSVIIVSYNQASILSKCLGFLENNLKKQFEKSQYEIIVVDNNSSPPIFKNKVPTRIKPIFLKENVGFSRANNVGLQMAKGKYVLFLNSDVYLKDFVDFAKLFEFLENDKKKAGLTIRLNLANGQIDPASHRGFPSPYNAACYFMGLEKLSQNIPGLNKLFGGYHLVHKNLNTVHEIDSPTAAFFLLKKKIIDHINGFDPDYFFYGEDLDLSYRIKKLGYSIWYYPKYKGVHLKHQSSTESQDKKTQQEANKYFYESMLIFYQKHYADKYPKWFNLAIKRAIKLKSNLDK